VGKTYKIEARKVVEEKEGNPIEQDIRKAIHHLQFELDRIYNNSNIKTGALAK
jgi:hypothetical protein